MGRKQGFKNSSSQSRWRRNNKDRSRPHPNDQQILECYPFSQDRTHTHLVLFTLAMCWSCEKDRIRLQMVLNNIPSTKLITVSWSQWSQGRMDHLDCGFNDRKGIRKLANRIKAEKLNYPEATITVILDWNWLHKHYYFTNYGLHNWIAYGIKQILEAGADNIILPNDDGDRQEGSSCMAAALSSVSDDAGFAFTFVSHEKNPLWVASDSNHIKEALAKFRGGDNMQNTKDWLHPQNPFVLFTSPAQ